MPVMSKRTFTEILKAKKLYLPILSQLIQKGKQCVVCHYSVR